MDIFSARFDSGAVKKIDPGAQVRGTRGTQAFVGDSAEVSPVPKSEGPGDPLVREGELTIGTSPVTR
jgi:hypothetical protein